MERALESLAKEQSELERKSQLGVLGNVFSMQAEIDVHKTTISTQAAEIERLKAELELRDKVIEQATKEMEIRYDTIWIYNGSEWVLVGSKTSNPDLFAHLAGRGE